MAADEASAPRPHAGATATAILGLGTVLAGTVTVTTIVETFTSLTVVSTLFSLGAWVPLTVVLGMLTWMVPNRHLDAPRLGFAVMGAIMALTLKQAVPATVHLLVAGDGWRDAWSPSLSFAIAALAVIVIVLLHRTETPVAGSAGRERRRAVAHRAYVVLTVAAGLDLVVLAVSLLPPPGLSDTAGKLPPIALGAMSALVAAVALSAAAGVRHGRRTARVVGIVSAGALAAKISTLLYAIVAVAGLGARPEFAPQWIFALLSPLAIIAATWALVLLWKPEVAQWCHPDQREPVS